MVKKISLCLLLLNHFFSCSAMEEERWSPYTTKKAILRICGAMKEVLLPAASEWREEEFKAKSVLVEQQFKDQLKGLQATIEQQQETIEVKECEVRQLRCLCCSLEWHKKNTDSEIRKLHDNLEQYENTFRNQRSQIEQLTYNRDMLLALFAEKTRETSSSSPEINYDEFS